MLKLSYVCRPHFAGSSFSRRSAPFICNKLLEYTPNEQKIPHITSCRLVSSKFSLNNQVQIYTGSLGKNIFRIKSLTLLTTSITIPIQNMFLMKNEQLMNNFWYRWFMITCIVFQVIMPFMVHFLGKRYVLRMYYNFVTDKYTMVTYRFIPVEKYTTFRASEVRPPNVEVFSTAVIREKFPVFIDPDQFTDIEHYKRLMGYDKPINFSDADEGNTEEAAEKSKESKEKEKLSDS